MNAPDNKKGSHQKVGRAPRVIYAAPALEELAKRLTPGTVGLEVQSRMPQKAGQIRGADHVLALQHVCELHPPVAWHLFWAKYMDDERSRAELLRWVEGDLRRQGMGTAHYRERLAVLVLGQFCDGRKVTGRAVGKALGVDRKRTWARLRPVVDRTLAYLFFLEMEVANGYRQKSS